MSGCNGNNGCCEGFYWNEDYKNCTKCPFGHVGSNCYIMCEYPNYGEECQHECTCPRRYCHVSFGCQQLSTTDDSLKDGKEEIKIDHTSSSQVTAGHVTGNIKSCIL
ncbi:uncharacterized protein LOC130052673 [Ostrea edulis]|uniref:uncharacterized protein LOC130052673 n=1 Tax=Ostrea edulis TaxID=37623 RepID=UPI0024AFD5E4|nr:uncharacterized protein LOC130052673 [Ostrea edulis]